jgi:flagellar hook-associated protein 2
MSSGLRITGMATGMDTDTTIKKLMKPYNMKVDKLKQDKQIVQWKQEMYREIMGDISALKTTYLDKLKPDSCVLLSKNYSGFEVNTASTSVSAVAAAGAIAGDYTVSAVKLATKATQTGGVFAGISSAGDKMSTLINGTASFSIQSNANTPVVFNYDFAGVDKDKTIGQIMNDISAKTGLNATFSELGKNFTLSSNNTGAAETIKTVTTSGNFLNVLFGMDPLGMPPTIDLAGKDGNATIKDPNGNSRTLPLTSNSLAIDGVTYSFIKDEPGSSTLSVKVNTQKAADKMSAFVAKYNDIVSKITTKLNEKAQKGYAPLSDEQKKEMKSEEITNWETKAKQGLLKNDGVLNSILNDLRGAIFGPVGGAGGAQLSDKMGIGTYSFSEGIQGGKIKFDEAKFKTALETNGTQLVNVLTATSATVPAYSRKLDSNARTARLSEEGVFQRISDILEDYTSNIYTDSNGKKGMLVEKAGIKGTASETLNLLYKDLVARDTKISNMEKYVADKENKYYLQFAKLETAMNKMNSQSSALSQQLGGN